MLFFWHSIQTRWKHLRLAKGRHGTHSPLVYRLMDQDLKIPLPDEIKQIEDQRKRWMQSSEKWEPLDYGAGSRATVKSLGNAVKHASSHPKKGAFLYRWVNRFQPQNILELGTNVGVSAAYMLMANEPSRITTLEGDPFLLKKSAELLGKFQSRVETVQGNFDETLGAVLPQKKWDLVVIDGNHRGEALRRYFYQILPHLSEDAWVIMDDIHWSPDMSSAWEDLVKDPNLMLTMDFYQWGIYGHRPRFNKEHFILKY
jgi:predicted O-methyltransferase YrrM